MRWALWAAVSGLFIELAWRLLNRDLHTCTPMKASRAWDASTSWTGGGDVL